MHARDVVGKDAKAWLNSNEGMVTPRIKIEQ
jgi:hypothetical protein